MARLWVAMSGGVDSSVAAALLTEAGHDVVGVTMQLWPSGEAEGGCCSVTAAYDAARVCDSLGIPHYALNFRDVFDENVIRPFCDDYARGMTPNPCVACNDRVKFSELLRRCLADGADGLATGHYARIVPDDCGAPWLARAADATKDQSYFLYRMTAQQLRHVVFPVGDLTKGEVRRIAAERGLPTAAARESQDVCFVPRGDYEAFFSKRCPEALERGPVVDASGAVLGRHEGLGLYTIGQRRGLPGGAPHPRYVVRIEADTNTVVAGYEADLASWRLVARDAAWRGLDTCRAGVQIRYRTAETPARVTHSGGSLDLELDEPVVGAAPGQAIVCYAGDRVVGGGTIWETR